MVRIGDHYSVVHCQMGNGAPLTRCCILAQSVAAEAPVVWCFSGDFKKGNFKMTFCHHWY